MRLMYGQIVTEETSEYEWMTVILKAAVQAGRLSEPEHPDQLEDAA